MKVFEGEAYRDLLDRTAGMFEKSKGFKPKASRGESVEMFVTGLGHRPEAQVEASDDPHALAPPRPKPSPGWGQ